MKLIVFFILILCAFGLYGAKYVNEQYRNGVLLEKIERAAKKALRFTLKGIVAVGLALLALSAFPLVREIGFAVLPAKLIETIRLIMQAILETNSVYAAIQIFAGAALLAVECSLIFSIVGLFVVKLPVILRVLECAHIEAKTELRRDTEVALPRIFRKIFLNFANLKI